MTTVNIAIVGLGQRGLQHLNALWQLDEARIVALCDPYPDNLVESRLQRFVDGFSIEGVRTYSAFADLLAAGGFDALYFAIPPSLHQGELLQAANTGIHLFAEKPVSLYLDEALEMDRAIREAGIIATVGFQQRHDNWHGEVRDFLADKRLLMITYVVNGTSNPTRPNTPTPRPSAARKTGSGPPTAPGRAPPWSRVASTRPT